MELDCTRTVHERVVLCLLGLAFERKQIPRFVGNTEKWSEGLEGLERAGLLRRQMLYPAELRVGPLIIETNIRMLPNHAFVSFPIYPQPFLIHRRGQARKTYETFSLLPILPPYSGSPHLFKARVAFPEIFAGTAHLFSSFSGMSHSPEIGIPLGPLPESLPVIFDCLDRSKNIVGLPKMFVGRSNVRSLRGLVLQSIGFSPHPFQLVVLLCHRSPLFRPRWA
jgi:hypothetical protein